MASASTKCLTTQTTTDTPTIITCLNSGGAIENIAGSLGARVIRTKVGSVEVTHRMIHEKAVVGFEENGDSCTVDTIKSEMGYVTSPDVRGFGH